MEYTQDQIDTAAAAGMSVEAYVAQQAAPAADEAPVAEEAAPETTEEAAA